VPTVTITCAGCDKKLRLSQRPEAGRKIKCPACGEIFVPAFDDDDAVATAIVERSSHNTRARTSPRHLADDDAPVRKPRRDDDDDDSKRWRDDDEDRPSQKKKKGKHKAGNHLILFGLVGACVLVLLLACSGIGVTAFVWPGFLLTKKNANEVAVVANNVAANNKNAIRKEQPKKEQPKPVKLNGFLMPDADLVFGLNVKSLRDANQFDMVLNQFRATQPDGLPQGFEEVARDCDQLLASMNVADMIAQGGVDNPFAPPQGPIGAPRNPPGARGGPGPNRPAPSPKIVVALALSSAEAATKAKDMIRNVPAMGAEEKLAGKYPAFRYRDPGGGETTIFAFASDRVLVVTPNSDQTLTALLDRADRNDKPSPQLAKMVALVERAPVWAAYTTDAQVRAGLAMLPAFLGDGKGLPPAVQAAAQALGKVKGISFGLETVRGGGAKLQLHVDFDDWDAARRLKDGAHTLKSMAMNKLANDPAAPHSLGQDLNTLLVSTNGTLASGTLTLSAQTIAKMQENVPGVRGPKGANQPPNFPKGRP
jgi:hypothetical protein